MGTGRLGALTGLRSLSLHTSSPPLTGLTGVQLGAESVRTQFDIDVSSNLPITEVLFKYSVAGYYSQHIAAKIVVLRDFSIKIMLK